MKLATLRSARPDGQLVVVSQDGTRFVSAGRIAPHLQAALDDWDNAAPALSALAAQLDNGAIAGQPFDKAAALAPLPRAYQWIDGSGYMGHLERVRSLKGSRDEELQSVRPMLYQGGSDTMLAPTDPIPAPAEDLALDFEAEVAIIIGPVSMRPSRAEAEAAIRLVTICNDVSLRRLVADDLQNGFGFFHAKPSTAFAPFAITPSGLGDNWSNNRLHLPLRVEVNGTLYGQPNAGIEVHFDFIDLIVEAARTRRLSAGTIIGSGTIANRHDETLPIKENGIGFACIAEARTAEKAKFGAARTPFLKAGDRLRIAAIGKDGQSVFGDMDNPIRAAE
ncbi:MAG: fumarylacetoacetate hydrolase family protein [Devosia sp.]|jgi:fumarylacetoacetate (FAA) hydrolase|uniref:fumarylacetoacetate hydrolase family protein n=1 Tax=unclassified Devosia TaxID=196773 RepID=UPI001A0AAAE8|nr:MULTISPECIES: fumarylacetoacetate hydrolase family protein [unclassified Devosia]MBF0678394.1 fumarylacetoacetate hydrolase family protein [Devosia sp.]WEJ32315.1 fumarylacetoacetate hydrolase family protein [Devosia sp. SD17-2]